jgi:hypothetical protein
MPVIKPRHTPPLGRVGLTPKLHVFHPHYETNNKLLALEAFDENNTIDYNVALIICGIICDNSWSNGWFARSNDGTNVCERGVPLAAGTGTDVFYFVGHPTCKIRR